MALLNYFKMEENAENILKIINSKSYVDGIKGKNRFTCKMCNFDNGSSMVIYRDIFQYQYGSVYSDEEITKNVYEELKKFCLSQFFKCCYGYKNSYGYMMFSFRSYNHDPSKNIITFNSPKKKEWICYGVKISFMDVNGLMICNSTQSNMTSSPWIIFPMKDIMDKTDINMVEILVNIILPQLAQHLSLDEFIPFNSNVKKAIQS